MNCLNLKNQTYKTNIISSLINEKEGVIGNVLIMLKENFPQNLSY